MTLKPFRECEIETIHNGKPTGKATERKIPSIARAADAPIDEKQGREEIEVGRKKLACRAVESERRLPSGKTNAMKSWANAGIPGRGAQAQVMPESGGGFPMTASQREKD
jgi:hypothetical protein